MPVKYSTTPERIYLGEANIEPGKRMRARQACASSKHKFAYLSVDVCASVKGGQKVTVTSSRDIAGLLRGFLEPQVALREHFGVLLLDAKNAVIGFALISVGGVSAALVELPMVFKPALLLPCSGIILVHNHPSGDPTPSYEDARLTERIVSAGKLLGIRVLDHIIVGAGRDDNYFSFLDRGLMPASE